MANSVAEALKLDYSEQSLQFVDDAVSILLFDPKAGESQNLIALDWAFEHEPDNERCAILAFKLLCYTFEVACRNMGFQWCVRKGFFSGTQHGIEYSKGGLFISIRDSFGVDRPSSLYESYLAHRDGIKVLPSVVYRNIRTRKG